MTPPPIVTGISPKEGPPGTRVTVRGENFGSSSRDLIGLTICGCDCILSAEWKSANKIIARSGPGKTKGDIIVITRSGGVGTCTVQFRGYYETIGPMKESAVWVDEAPMQYLGLGRRSMSPSSYQQQDPLGLSVETVSKPLPEDEILELFPTESSGSLGSEMFMPARFLLENHHATSFDDLKAGLAHLQRKSGAHKEGQLSFLKDNVGAVMDQLDTLCSLKERFEDDKLFHGSEPTKALEIAIDASRGEALRLFQEVLTRRDKADATRNALSAMQRNRFLFSLPSQIERNSRKGDYDLVVNDVARAHSLFGGSDIPIFQRVFMEVEQRINSLRLQLQTRLTTMPCPLEEQKKLIRNLISLDASGNPAWEAIEARHKFLLTCLASLREKHIGSDTHPSSPGKKLVTPSPASKGSGKNNLVAQQADWQGEPPTQVQLVEEAVEAVSEQFPELWRLGQAYFSGELQTKVLTGQHAKFKDMVLEGITSVCLLVRAALVPPPVPAPRAGTQSPARSASTAVNMAELGPWLPHCVAQTLTLHRSLSSLDLPTEAIALVTNLIQELRLHCMSAILKQATEQVRHLYKRETWVLELPHHMSQGGSKPSGSVLEGGSITSLPALFEERVSEAVTLLRESVLASAPGEQREASLLANPTAHRQYGTLVQGLLLAFTQTFEQLSVSKEVRNSSSLSLSQLISSPAASQPPSSSSRGDSGENKLLIILSNCLHTRDVTLPSVMKILSTLTGSQETPPLALAREAAMASLNTLDKSLCESYLESRTDPLVGTIEPSMYLGRFDWGTWPGPRSEQERDVRPYIKEILANLIAVNAEVQKVCPGQCRRVLAHVVEMVAEEVARLMSCIASYSEEGALQAHIDLALLRKALDHYSTPTAKAFFNEALDAVPALKTTAQKKSVEQTLVGINARMKLQLLGLSASNGLNVALGSSKLS